MAPMRTQVRCDCLLVFFTLFPLLAMLPEAVFQKIGSGNIAEPVFRTVDFRQSCRRSRKIGSDNFIKMFAPTFRQCCQKVTARRRHWGQGISPASGVLTSKRYACAPSPPGRRGPQPRRWRSCSKTVKSLNLGAEPAAPNRLLLYGTLCFPDLGQHIFRPIFVLLDTGYGTIPARSKTRMMSHMTAKSSPWPLSSKARALSPGKRQKRNRQTP